MDEEEYKPIVQKIVDLAENITGCTIDDLCPDTNAARYFRALMTEREAA